MTTARKGFALLITITLLAFLVLLLVSLAALTRVETQVASNTQHLSQARQNALLALNIALGQLQKFAGPDQRVTTPADLLAKNDPAGAPYATTVSTAARIDVQPGTRYWTGAWGNGEAAIGYDLRPDQIPGRGVTPVLLNWLVSGNETADFSPNGAKGGVTATTAPGHTPASVIDYSPTSTTAVRLVGGNSSSGLPEDEVAAPLIPIYAPAGATPGIDTSTTPALGYYAWWVGDEGVKARINLQNGYQKTGQSSDRIHSFLTAQRAAPEFMDRDPAGAASPTRVDTAYDFTSAGLPNILSQRQLPLLNSALAGTAKNRFHDITATSAGVLSDTYAGGLKKDITADIADTSASVTAGYRPADSDPIFTPLDAGEANLPSWGHLRSWARATPVLNTLTGSKELSPIPANGTRAGISPILIHASVGYMAYLEDNAGVYTLRMAIYPAIYLANPYPTTMAAARYDVGVRFQPGARARIETVIATPTTPNSNSPWTTHATLDFGSLGEATAIIPGSPAGSTFTASNWLRFEIDCQPIPPGEVHLYRLDDLETGSIYAPGKLLTRAPAETSPGAPMALGLTNHLRLPATFVLPAAVSDPDDYAFRINRINVAGDTDNNAWMETVLSEVGGLDDPDRRYQLFNMITGRGTFETIHPIGTPIGTWVDNGFYAAEAAIRLGFPMETFINWMKARYGMAEIHKMNWLWHGNFRAPLGIATRYETDTTVPYVGGPATLARRAGTMLCGSIVANDTVSGRDAVGWYPTRGYATSMGGVSGASTHIMDASLSSVLNRAVLFDLLDSPDRLLSLGQLQHVPFSRHMFSPAYPFGNAMADIRVPRIQTHVEEGIVERMPGKAAAGLDPVYDLSWHLNRALWDRFFVSGVPVTQPDIATPLPNARMTVYHRSATTPTLLSSIKFTTGEPNEAYAKAASALLVSGAFNINSTSEQAWRAVLGGPLGLPADTDGAIAAEKLDEIVPYARFARHLRFPGDTLWADTETAPTMRVDITTPAAYRTTNYLGNRGLWLNVQKGTKTTTNNSAETVVAELATKIVREIRRNGPFLSLADFINRPILATKQPAGIKGPLQAAIDTMSPSKAQANPVPPTNFVRNKSTPSSNYHYRNKWDFEHFYGGPTTGSGGSLAHDGEADTDVFAYANAFGPKYLTQADLLSTLGPQLTARSDTFTIRTYGDARNPATGDIESKAWCEAVVQRRPDYVDSAQAPEAIATGINATFGRRFQIVSFRWLSPNDI